MYTKNFPTGPSRERASRLLKKFDRGTLQRVETQSPRGILFSRRLTLDDFRRRSGSMASRVENRRSNCSLPVAVGWGFLFDNNCPRGAERDSGEGFGEEMFWKLPTGRTCSQRAIRFENE